MKYNNQNQKKKKYDPFYRKTRKQAIKSIEQTISEHKQEKIKLKTTLQGRLSARSINKLDKLLDELL